jgi:hypothetical protein
VSLSGSVFVLWEKRYTYSYQSKHDCRNPEEDRVNQDNVEDVSPDPCVVENQTEARVKDDGLRNDKRKPRKFNDDERANIVPDLEVVQHNGQAVDGDAPATRYAGPKV